MIKEDLSSKVMSGLLFDGEYGIEIETETKKKYTPPSFTYWDVKPDGSLRDFGQEYVLKAPLNFGEQLTEGLREFHDKTKSIPFIVDSNSTSVHVHCNILPETWQSVGNFLTIYTLVENLLMEVAGDSRRNNLFCLPIRSVPTINTTSLTIFKMVQKKDFGFSRVMDMNSVKYAALNLATIFRFGSLEIRSFRGETNIDVIQSWVNIIHRIREFSRENITPPEILDRFRDSGKKFLKDIFKDEWEEMKHENEDKMIMDNLWFAGRLAYFFSPSDWKKMDIRPPKPEIPDGINIKELDYESARHYGMLFSQLHSADQKKIISLVQLNKKRVKSKQVFTNPITEMQWTTALGTPGGVVTNWSLSTDEASNGGN